MKKVKLNQETNKTESSSEQSEDDDNTDEDSEESKDSSQLNKDNSIDEKKSSDQIHSHVTEENVANNSVVPDKTNNFDNVELTT